MLAFLRRLSEWLGLQGVKGALVMVLLVWAAAPARSADYRIDFAIESEIGEEVGNVGTCEFNRSCFFEAKSLGYRLSALFLRNTQHALVQISKGVDCCFFSGAAVDLRLQVTENLARIPFFEGRRARGDLFIENKKVGVLYLHFSFPGSSQRPIVRFNHVNYQEEHTSTIRRHKSHNNGS